VAPARGDLATVAGLRKATDDQGTARALVIPNYGVLTPAWPSELNGGSGLKASIQADANSEAAMSPTAARSHRTGPGHNDAAAPLSERQLEILSYVSQGL
jgi:hypothetical protein